MHIKLAAGRAVLAAVAAIGAGVLLPAVASAHARISPPFSVAGKLQLYSLAVPTEKAGLTTTCKHPFSSRARRLFRALAR